MAIYGFKSKSEALALKRVARSLVHKPEITSQQGPSGGIPVASQVVTPVRAPAGGRGEICFTPAGGIPPLTGIVPGSAECDLWEMDADGELVVKGVAKKVYNVSADPVPAELYVTAQFIDGALVVSGGGASAKIFFTPSGGIPAMTSVYPGVALCRRWDFYQTVAGNDGYIEDSTVDEYVYNLMSSPISQFTYIITSTVLGGNFASAEDCPTAPGPTNPGSL